MVINIILQMKMILKHAQKKQKMQNPKLIKKEMKEKKKKNQVQKILKYQMQYQMKQNRILM